MSRDGLYENIPRDPFSLRVSKFDRKGYAFREHWHEHTEIHLILKGSCRLNCNGEQIELCEGDCAVINSGELHRGGSGDCVFLCLLLSPTFFSETYIIFDRRIRDAYVSALFPSVAKLAESDTPLPDLLEGRGAVHLLMAHLIRHYTLRELRGSLYARHISKLEKINQAVTYIHEHYKEPLTTSHLAKKFYMSEGYFCQLFRDVMKQSAVDYLNSVRVEKAAHLLTGTDMSISRIALCCGFSDANYFSRVYKKLKKETPTATREKG